MSDEKSWQDDNGRHRQLDAHLEFYEMWEDLVGQIVGETGITRDDAVALIWSMNAVGAWDVLEGLNTTFGKMLESFNVMARHFEGMADSYKGMEERWKENHASTKRLRELAEKQMEDIDDDAPWKDPE